MSSIAPVSTPDADDAAVRVLYDRHAGELFGYALKALGDAGAAEDVVQETFVRAWRFADSYRPERGPVRGWLFGITRRLVIDHARARAKRPEPASVADDAVALDPELRAVEERIVLLEALARLSDDHRRVLVEIALKERTLAEVADDLGVPVGTVKSRLFYGLRTLRLAAEELGVEMPS